MSLRKRVIGVGVATAMFGGFAALPISTATASPAAPTALATAKKPGVYYPLPISGIDQFGNTFSGLVTKLSTYVRDGRLMATGMISTTDPATGRIVNVPFTTQITDVAVNGTRHDARGQRTAAAAAIPTGCTVLHLDLAPLQLDLLGLVVTLPNPLVVDITAVPGAGNLLGNLLCAVAGLLDGGGLLTNLLGAISALLDRLLSGLGLGL